MLWASETHLPGWPPGPNDGVTVRAVRAARDVVRRMAVVRNVAQETADDEISGGDAA